jgi:DNA-binding transcriptional LysR family regulator
MPRKLPRHLIWLEAFIAAVETGSLEGAARHLGVARSVVSDHLKALENALVEGHPLLERGPGRKLRLTARGERLYEAAQGPLHQLDPKRLRDHAGLEASLRLGLNPTLSSLLLPAIAQEAAAAGIKLEASFGGAHELVRQVQTRQLDLALGFTPLPTQEGVQARSLLSLPFVVLAAPGNPLMRSKVTVLRVADLDGQTFVDWLRDDPYGGANRARFETAGISVKEAGRAESFLHLFELLRAYRACAIAPDLGRLSPFPEDLRTWPLKESKALPVEVVALLPSGTPSPETVRVLDSLRKRIRSKRR